MISSSTVFDAEGNPHTIRTVRTKRRAEGHAHDGKLYVAGCQLLDPPRTSDGEPYVSYPSTTDNAVPRRVLRIQDADYIQLFEQADDYVFHNAQHDAFTEPMRSYIRLCMQHHALPEKVVTSERGREMTKQRWMYQALDFAKVPILTKAQEDQLLRAAFTAKESRDARQKGIAEEVMRYYEHAGWTVELVRPYRRQKNDKHSDVTQLVGSI